MQILGCGNVKKLIFTGFFLKNRLKKQIRGARGSVSDGGRTMLSSCKEQTSNFLAARARLLHFLTGEGYVDYFTREKRKRIFLWSGSLYTNESPVSLSSL